MPGWSTYYSLNSIHYSFQLPLIILSNLIKEERSVRVISNELNDTLRVFETININKLTNTLVPSPATIHALNP